MKHFCSVLLDTINPMHLKRVNAKLFSKLLLISLCFLPSHYSYAMKINWTENVKRIITKKIYNFKKDGSINALIKNVNITLSDVTPTTKNLIGLEKMIDEVYILKLSMSDAQRDEFIAHTFINRVMDIKDVLGIVDPADKSSEGDESDGEKDDYPQKLIVKLPPKSDKSYPTTQQASSAGNNLTQPLGAEASYLNFNKPAYQSTLFFHGPVLSDATWLKVKEQDTYSDKPNKAYPHDSPLTVSTHSPIPKPSTYPTYEQSKQQITKHNNVSDEVAEAVCAAEANNHEARQQIEQLGRELKQESDAITIKHKEQLLQEMLSNLVFSEYWLKPEICNHPSKSSTLNSKDESSDDDSSDDDSSDDESSDDESSDDESSDDESSDDKNCGLSSNFSASALIVESDTTKYNFNIELESLNDRLSALGLLIDKLKHNDNQQCEKQLVLNTLKINTYLNKFAIESSDAQDIERQLAQGNDRFDVEGLRASSCKTTVINKTISCIDDLFNASKDLCTTLVSVFGGQNEDIIDHEFMDRYKDFIPNPTTADPVNDYFETWKNLLYLYMTNKIVSDNHDNVIPALCMMNNPMQRQDMLFVGFHHIFRKTITKYLVTALHQNNQQDISVWADRVLLCSYLSREILGTCKPTKLVRLDRLPNGSDLQAAANLYQHIKETWKQCKSKAQVTRDKKITNEKNYASRGGYDIRDRSYFEYYNVDLDALDRNESPDFDELPYIFELNRITKRPVMIQER